MKSNLLTILILLVAFGFMATSETRAKVDGVSENTGDSFIHYKNPSELNPLSEELELFKENRTVYYFGFANFSTSKNAQQIFISTIRSTSCPERNQIQYGNNIAYSFTEHIEAYYKSDLGTWHRWNQRLGHWDWDSTKDLIRSRAGYAKQYRDAIFVDDFVWACD